jgi:hypothetical protein
VVEEDVVISVITFRNKKISRRVQRLLATVGKSAVLIHDMCPRNDGKPKKSI